MRDPLRRLALWLDRYALSLLVETEKDKAALEASGVKDVIYTHPEDGIRAHHRIKKAFPSSLDREELYP